MVKISYHNKPVKWMWTTVAVGNPKYIYVQFSHVLFCLNAIRLIIAI